MIVHRGAQVIQASGVSHFSWAGLGRFANVQATRKKIIERWRLPSRHHANAEKQAAQLSFCLSQAKEYFEAAKFSSLATRPMQLYYGCMSLALAEILWKGDGKMSLDQLRQNHAHHGLELKLGNLKLLDGISPTEQLGAKLNNEANPTGTFSAWQQIARNAPLVGALTTQTPDGSIQLNTGIIYVPDDFFRPMMPKGGLSFLDCIKNIPSFFHFLPNIGTFSDLVRCTITRRSVHSENLATISDRITIHPGPPTCIDGVMSDISFRAIMFEKIRNRELSSGCILDLEYDSTLPQGSLRIPEGTTLNPKITFLRKPQSPLTEFAAYYVGLYISGMFCRYFPDVWMKHIASHSEFLTVVEHLCNEAYQRLPLISLCELDQIAYVLPE